MRRRRKGPPDEELERRAVELIGELRVIRAQLALALERIEDLVQEPEGQPTQGANGG